MVYYVPHAVLVGEGDPAGGWKGEEVVGEVDEGIDEVPLIEAERRMGGGGGGGGWGVFAFSFSSFCWCCWWWGWSSLLFSSSFSCSWFAGSLPPGAGSTKAMPVTYMNGWGGWMSRYVRRFFPIRPPTHLSSLPPDLPPYPPCMSWHTSIFPPLLAASCRWALGIWGKGRV